MILGWVTGHEDIADSKEENRDPESLRVGGSNRATEGGSRSEKGLNVKGGGKKGDNRGRDVVASCNVEQEAPTP